MERINFFEKGQAALKAINGLAVYLNRSSGGRAFAEPCYFRVSQLNSCAYMHSKYLRVKGEPEQRIYLPDA